MKFKIETEITDQIEGLLQYKTSESGGHTESYGTVYEEDRLVGLLLIVESKVGEYWLPYRYILEEYRRKGIGEQLYHTVLNYLLSKDNLLTIGFKSNKYRSGWKERRLKEGFDITAEHEFRNG